MLLYSQADPIDELQHVPAALHFTVVNWFTKASTACRKIELRRRKTPCNSRSCHPQGSFCCSFNDPCLRQGFEFLIYNRDIENPQSSTFSFPVTRERGCAAPIPRIRFRRVFYFAPIYFFSPAKILFPPCKQSGTLVSDMF